MEVSADTLGRWLLGRAAWARGFQGAARKAFVGDGSANNWKLQRRLLGWFVPILDFIHALSYVFAAATAGRKFAAGWACYPSWIAWVWQGQVGRVIAALEGRQAELGAPRCEEPETSPRKVLAKTLGYLRHHQDKMHYDEYRRLGMPIGSSLIESVVKQVNRRVKGTESFWSEQGGEAIQQLRADHRERRPAAGRLLATPPSDRHRPMPLPPRELITNQVVHPMRQRSMLAARGTRQLGNVVAREKQRLGRQLAKVPL